jgi:hypothetical protein
MFLDLDIPDDDPLRPAKVFVSTAAPGFRLFDEDNSIDWESDYIWLVVINEEDGLDFRVRQTVDGKREIQGFWKERELDDTSKLREYLQEDVAWDVYQLRATVLLQSRVEAQMETIQAMQGLTQELTVRDVPWKLSERLRSLELEMLQRAALALDIQVRTLVLPAPRIFCSSQATCVTVASGSVPEYCRTRSICGPGAVAKLRTCGRSTNQKTFGTLLADQ